MPTVCATSTDGGAIGGVGEATCCACALRMERYLDMRGGSRASTGFDSVCVAIFAGNVEVVVRKNVTESDRWPHDNNQVHIISWHGICLARRLDFHGRERESHKEKQMVWALAARRGRGSRENSM